MRRVPFNPPDGFTPAQETWWRDWAARAATAQAALNTSFGRPELAFDTTVWRDLKNWLADNVFVGKCAYCEGNYRATDHGEAEHYRPKGNVTVRDKKVKRKVLLQENTPHPGYYWLAFDWHNIIPACKKCNGEKSDQFPAKQHIFDITSLSDVLDEAEGPLLINPYLEDPNTYLAFDDLGFVYAKNGDEKGQATIEVMKLNRDEYVDNRKRLIDLSNSAIVSAIQDKFRHKIDYTVSLDPWINAKAPYSQALRAYINAQLEAFGTETGKGL